MRLLFSLIIFLKSVNSIDIDTEKAIDLLNHLVDHPREVIDELKHYQIDELIKAIGIGKFSHSYISPECSEELNFFTDGVLEMTRHRKVHANSSSPPLVMTDEEMMNYLIPMMDAAGKMSSGIARGHLLSSGQFTECRRINMYSKRLGRNIRGDFYRILLDLRMRPNGRQDACGIPQIGIDVCLPMSCKSDDLTRFFRSGIREDESLSPICSIRNINQRVHPVNTMTYIVTSFLVTIAVICLTGALLDYYRVRRYGKLDVKSLENNFLWNLFISFSFYRNVREVFTTSNANRPGQVSSLNCIRVISTVWVIMGHCAACMIVVCSNPLDMIDYSKTYLGLFMANAYLAVDTFFYLSGFLLAFIWFKQLSKRRNFLLSSSGWILFYLHRFLRLTPVYYITIFFVTFIYTRVFVVDMPQFMSPAVEDDSCPRNFWLNLLYIDNIVDPKHICYVISWYLATDMQIFIFSPILLIAFAVYGRKTGLIIIAVVLVISTGFNAFQVLFWYFPPTQFEFGPKHPKFRESNRRYDLWNYYNPIIRCQVYVIGFVVGYFMQSKAHLKINPWIDRLMWILSLSLMVLVTLVLKSYTSGPLWTQFQSMMYSCFSRIFWSAGLTWVIFSTYYRQGLIHDFMSLKFWTPLARLSFSAYLIHIMVVAYYFGKNHSDLFFLSMWQFICEAVIPVTVVTFVLSIFWTCFFEIPFAKIIDLLIGTKKPNQTKITPKMKEDEHYVHKIPINPERF